MIVKTIGRVSSSIEMPSTNIPSTNNGTRMSKRVRSRCCEQWTAQSARCAGICVVARAMLNKPAPMIDRRLDEVAVPVDTKPSRIMRCRPPCFCRSSSVATSAPMAARNKSTSEVWVAID